MSTTPNYSWPLIENTDFVTNLPADLETLADAIDDTVKDLNPGTTAGDLDYYTSSTAKARLAIGTAGQVLRVNSGATAPEWHTPGTGLTQLATGTLSGATVNLTSISGSYKNLQLVIRGFRPATDGTNLLMRLNGDTNTRYRWIRFNESDTNYAFNTSSIRLCDTQDDTEATSLIVVDLLDYANATTWKMVNTFATTVSHTAPTEFGAFRANGYYNQTAAITEINLFCGGGNFTAGTYFLYGAN